MAAFLNMNTNATTRGDAQVNICQRSSNLSSLVFLGLKCALCVFGVWCVCLVCVWCVFGVCVVCGVCVFQAYVELNELRGSTWQETGRWVGFEENMNPATGTWSPSHISYLTFKSLIQLRKTMSTGDTHSLNENACDE